MRSHLKVLIHNIILFKHSNYCVLVVEILVDSKTRKNVVFKLTNIVKSISPSLSNRIHLLVFIKFSQLKVIVILLKENSFLKFEMIMSFKVLNVANGLLKPQNELLFMLKENKWLIILKLFLNRNYYHILSLNFCKEF